MPRRPSSCCPPIIHHCTIFLEKNRPSLPLHNGQVVFSRTPVCTPSSQENLWCSDSPRYTQAPGTLYVCSVVVGIQGKLCPDKPVASGSPAVVASRTSHRDSNSTQGFPGDPTAEVGMVSTGTRLSIPVLRSPLQLPATWALVLVWAFKIIERPVLPRVGPLWGL